MAIDFSRQVYEPAFSVFARAVTFTPLVSQPGAPAFTGRGIYNTVPIDVLTENATIFSEQQTILDVMENEFPVPLVQGDHLTIPASGAIAAVGDFEIIETKTNGGGEITLVLRKLMVSQP